MMTPEDTAFVPTSASSRGGAPSEKIRLPVPNRTGAHCKVGAARLSRCSLRVQVEKNLAHLARRTAGDGTLARPRQRLVQISGFKYPKPLVSNGIQFA
jgi:hypothetical protein